MSYGGFQSDEDAAAARSAASDDLSAPVKFGRPKQQQSITTTKQQVANSGDYVGISSAGAVDGSMGDAASGGGVIRSNPNPSGLPVAEPIHNTNDPNAYHSGGANADPEAQTGGGGGGGGGSARGESLFERSSAVYFALFLGFIFVLFLANMSVYGNARSSTGGTSSCEDLSGYVALIGFFCLFIDLFGLLILVLWWQSGRAGSNAEPFHFGTSSILRWGTVLMAVFWLCVFFVGFAAMKWISSNPCGVSDVKEMSTADVVFCWFGMAATIYLLVTRRPQLAASV